MREKSLFFSTYPCVILAALLLASSYSLGQSRDLSFNETCAQPSERVTLSFVGDVLVHGAIYKNVVATSKDFTQVWRRTNGLIQKADFSVANLEGPAALGVDSKGRDLGDIGFVYDEKVYSGSNFSFNYHPRILGDLKNSGYDLLTLANNHSLDRSSLGVDKTVLAARDIHLPVVGVRHSQERSADFHKVIDIKGLRVAFLGCTESTNGIPDVKDQILLCYKNSDRVISIIRGLAAQADVDAIIVLPHWGVEYSGAPEAKQKQMARLFLDAGATAIIGSHPHVLQPWEKYITSDGRETLIAYSLGNFVAWQSGLPKKVGTVLYLGLSKKNAQGAKIYGVGYAPTIREGYEVYTVDSSRGDVIKHVRQFFGDKGRLGRDGSVEAILCQ